MDTRRAVAFVAVALLAACGDASPDPRGSVYVVSDNSRLLVGDALEVPVTGSLVPPRVPPHAASLYTIERVALRDEGDHLRGIGRGSLTLAHVGGVPSYAMSLMVTIDGRRVELHGQGPSGDSFDPSAAGVVLAGVVLSGELVDGEGMSAVSLTVHAAPEPG